MTELLEGQTLYRQTFNSHNILDVAAANDRTFSTSSIIESGVVVGSGWVAWACDFGSPVTVAVARVADPIGNNYWPNPSGALIQHSDDGSSWTSSPFTLTSYTVPTNLDWPLAQETTEYRYTLDTPSSHRWWRIRSTSYSGFHAGTGVGEIYLDDAGSTPPENPPPITVQVGTVQFTNLKRFEMRAVLNEAGSFHFVINRADPQATAANLARGNIVQVVIPQIHSDILWEGILETGDFDHIREGEEGDEDLQFGGPGTLAILQRVVMDSVQYEGARVECFPKQGVWIWENSAGYRTEGDILRRMINEAESTLRPGYPILPDITRTFSDSYDTDDVYWGDEALEGQWKTPIGVVVYDEVIRLANAGLVNVEMAPGFVMNAWRNLGRDLTSTTFATGKVRFAKGVNIVGELKQGMAGSQWATRAVVRRADGKYTRASLSGTFPYPQEMYFESNSDSSATAQRQAQGNMRLREEAQEAYVFGVLSPLSGNDREWTPDAAGRVHYLPGPSWSDWGQYWLGDLVTLHAENDQDEFEFVNVTQRIYAITLRLDEETGELAIPLVELNAPWRGKAASSSLSLSPTAGASSPTSSGSTSGGSGSGSGYHTHSGYATSAEIAEQSWKHRVRVATTANVAISTALNAGDVIDGVTLVAGDRVLVKSQTAPAENGIYIANPTPTRATDFDEDDEILGAVVVVVAGTTNAGTAWRVSNLTTPDVGTDGITFVAFGSGSSLTPGSAAGEALVWDGDSYEPTTQYASIVAVIDGGGSAITTGVKGDVRIPFACEIVRASLLADQTGSVVVDLWRDTYANYPPTVADTITASAKPTISSGVKSEDSTLTGWSTSCPEGSTIRYNVDSAATVQRVTVELKVRRT